MIFLKKLSFQSESRTFFVFEDFFLNAFQFSLDFLVFVIITALFLVVLKNLYLLFFHDIFFGNVKDVASSILFTIILVELISLLFSYIREHVIKIERVVEIGIISIIRESLFFIFESDYLHIFAVSFLLFVMSLFYFLEQYYLFKYKVLEENKK